jgi:hypothetical protein
MMKREYHLFNREQARLRHTHTVNGNVTLSKVVTMKHMLIIT